VPLGFPKNLLFGNMLVSKGAHTAYGTNAP
jgi:hypothetical protein